MVVFGAVSHGTERFGFVRAAFFMHTLTLAVAIVSVFALLSSMCYGKRQKSKQERKVFVMREITIRMIGTTPLLLHRICRHEFREALAWNGSLAEPLEEGVKETMSKDIHGKPAVPVWWLWDALARGCAQIVVGGKRIQHTRFQSRLTLPAGTAPLLGKNGAEPVIRVFLSRQHASHGSRKMIAVVAPRFDYWELRLRAFVDDSFSNDTLQLIFGEAGKCGIGLFHPPKKQFGQFRCVVELGNA